MDLLVFGHDGPKVIVFPTSQGRFYEYEDNKMIEAVADRLENGQLQIYCVDSVDSESWYNKWSHPYWRIQRHLAYERYILNDVIPLMWNKNWNPRVMVTGCSFGAYHALNFAMRHPDKVTDCVCMAGSYDIKKFLDGWYADDVYFVNPPDYLANCTDGWRYNHIRTVLSTGEWDMCWNDNERMADIMRPAASDMSCTSGATAAITTGPGGDRWQGRTWGEDAMLSRMSIAQRLERLPWDDFYQSLSELGYAVTPPLLLPEECAELRALYAQDDLFRSIVIMERVRFGLGDYKYFANPLPEIVRELRTYAYPPLAEIANRWALLAGERSKFPRTHEEFLAICHRAGQTRPTPLLLHYEQDGYNCLHRDIYGAIAFPMQMVFLLGQHGRDWEGGEFVLVENRLRAQSRAEVVSPDEGCAIVFTTRYRPLPRSRARADMRHGVARVRSGSRYTLGIIFHDAE